MSANPAQHGGGGPSLPCPALTKIYGTLTTFNVLFENKNQHFTGQKATSDRSPIHRF